MQLIAVALPTLFGWQSHTNAHAAQVPMPDALALVALAKVSPVREHGVCPVADVCCRKNRPCRLRWWLLCPQRSSPRPSLLGSITNASRLILGLQLRHG